MVPSQAGSWMVALYRLAAAEDVESLDRLLVKVARHGVFHFLDSDYFGALWWIIGDLRGKFTHIKFELSWGVIPSFFLLFSSVRTSNINFN